MAPPAQIPGFNLYWHDDFRGRKGSAPDPKVWQVMYVFSLESDFDSRALMFECYDRAAGPNLGNVTTFTYQSCPTYRRL